MSKITNTQTLDALRQLGCLTNDDVNNKAVATLLAQRLEADHIAESLDDVQTVAATVGQLASSLIGGEDPDFVDHIRPLLSAGAAGKVQQALTNGYVLCAGRAKIEISIEGELVSKSVATRFLSADHDVIERYVLEPRIKRVESVATSALELQELVGERQPEMTERLGVFVERLNITWQRAITRGAE